MRISWVGKSRLPEKDIFFILDFHDSFVILENIMVFQTILPQSNKEKIVFMVQLEVSKIAQISQFSDMNIFNSFTVSSTSMKKWLNLKFE